jgi:hypothetical protein
LSWRRPQTATRHPAEEKANAAARPIPEVPPVITMDFPLILPVFPL